MMSKSLIIAALLIFAGGQGLAAEQRTADKPETVKINIINAEGKEVGKATVRETPTGVLIRVELRKDSPGISPGTHAIHIHEVGKCEPPFKSAGGHFNALGKKHGFLDKEGPHVGDLPNIHVPENSPLTVEFFETEISLSGGDGNLLDSDGSALVIHAGEDDYHTDPAGDSGDRVACGVIGSEAQTQARPR